MKKYIAITSVVVIIIAGIAFYGGMRYNQQNNATARGRFTGMGGRNGQMMGGRGGFSTGEILSKDTTSITIKIPTGGSKIIFLTDKTPVSKSVQGSSNDLAPGQQVMVNGTPNSDGSINAQSIQIRPVDTTKQN